MSIPVIVLWKMICVDSGQAIRQPSRLGIGTHRTWDIQCGWCWMEEYPFAEPIKYAELSCTTPSLSFSSLTFHSSTVWRRIFSSVTCNQYQSDSKWNNLNSIHINCSAGLSFISIRILNLDQVIAVLCSHYCNESLKYDILQLYRQSA